MSGVINKKMGLRCPDEEHREYSVAKHEQKQEEVFLPPFEKVEAKIAGDSQSDSESGRANAAAQKCDFHGVGFSRDEPLEFQTVADSAIFVEQLLLADGTKPDMSTRMITSNDAFAHPIDCYWVRIDGKTVCELFCYGYGLSNHQLPPSGFRLNDPDFYHRQASMLDVVSLPDQHEFNGIGYTQERPLRFYSIEDAGDYLKQLIFNNGIVPEITLRQLYRNPSTTGVCAHYFVRFGGEIVCELFVDPNARFNQQRAPRGFVFRDPKYRPFKTGDQNPIVWLVWLGGIGAAIYVVWKICSGS
ncbi:MAG: hypothetical protein ACI8UO_005753 [Verrucomicrobiales bacterium]